MEHQNSDNTLFLDADIDAASNQLVERWNRIVLAHGAIARHLDTTKDLLDGELSQKFTQWSQWFSQPKQIDELLSNPAALALVGEFLADEVSNDEISEDQYQLMSTKAASNGFAAFGFTQSISRRMWVTVRYPVLLAILLLGLWTTCTIYVSPVIGDLIEEYELECPVIVRLVVGELPYLHYLTWALATIVAVLLLLALLAAFVPRLANFLVAWLDHRLSSTRYHVGRWAWHVSMLLQCGVNEPEAFSIAVGCIKCPWLKENILRWRKDCKDAGDATKVSVASGPFPNSPFHLLNTSLTNTDTTQKTRLLNIAATYYVDRDRNISSWWFRVVVWLIMWNMFLLIGLVVLGFYLFFYSVYRSFFYWW